MEKSGVSLGAGQNRETLRRKHDLWPWATLFMTYGTYGKMSIHTQLGIFYFSVFLFVR